jgi:hypothetical protein
MTLVPKHTDQFGRQNLIENVNDRFTVGLAIVGHCAAFDMSPGALSHFVNRGEGMAAEISDGLLLGSIGGHALSHCFHSLRRIRGSGLS